MLFTLLIKILRCSCPNCHHFKMNKNAVKRYEIQFRLILVLVHPSLDSRVETCWSSESSSRSMTS
mgnify:CR=1 FL=1